MSAHTLRLLPFNRDGIKQCLAEAQKTLASIDLHTSRLDTLDAISEASYQLSRAQERVEQLVRHLGDTTHAQRLIRGADDPQATAAKARP